MQEDAAYHKMMQWPLSGLEKQLIKDMRGHSLEDDLLVDLAKRIARIRVSDEAQEGMNAFLDKRRPRWQ